MPAVPVFRPNANADAVLLSPRMLAQILQALVKMIKGGRGIACRWFQNELIIEATAQPAPAASGIVWIVGETEQQILNQHPAEGSFCRTTLAGNQRAFVYLGGALICFSHTR